MTDEEMCKLAGVAPTAQVLELLCLVRQNELIKFWKSTQTQIEYQQKALDGMKAVIGKEKNAAIVVTKEESLWPVQVSVEEFMMRVAGNEDMVGKPVIWTQWPKEAKPPKS